MASLMRDVVVIMVLLLHLQSVRGYWIPAFLGTTSHTASGTERAHSCFLSKTVTQHTFVDLRQSPITSFGMPPWRLAAAPVDNDEVYVKAQDLEALQTLFGEYCDNEGLMTKDAVRKIPAISELLVGCGCYLV